MTALISALVNVVGTLYIGIVLINPNGTINTNGSAPVTIASSSQADVRSGIDAAAISYASGLGYTITAADVVSILQPATARTFTNPTRTLNSAFQISTTQDVQVSYVVNVAATLSLTTGATGTVVLEYADDSGITTNVVTVQTSVNGNTGTLAIGLGLTQTSTASLSGTVPAGKYVRIRTVNTTGSPTFTMGNAQEVLIN